MESPLSVANFFIKKGAIHGEFVTPMKLLKLVYIAHGWELAIKDLPLFADPVEAWKYGPVIPALYQQFKSYRTAGIDQPAAVLNDKYEYTIPEVRPETLPLLEKIWEVYAPYSAIQLSTMTHAKGTPWYQVWEEQGGSKELHAVIGNEVTKKYYRSQINPQRG